MFNKSSSVIRRNTFMSCWLYQTNNDVVIRGLLCGLFGVKCAWQQSRTCLLRTGGWKRADPTQHKWVNRSNPTLFNEFYTRKMYLYSWWTETTLRSFIHELSTEKISIVMEASKHNTLVFLTCPKPIFV